MSNAIDETAVANARQMRDTARTTLKTDIATLRQGIPNRIIGGVTDTLEDGVDLARENRVVLGLGVSGIMGWLFREPLGTFGHYVLAQSKRVASRWRR